MVRILTTVLLGFAITVPACGQGAAIVVSLPTVHWSIPGTEDFYMNDPLKLALTVDRSADQIEARVFEGGKDALLQRARTSPAGVCTYYRSFILYVTSTTGGFTFNWTFRPYSVYAKQDGLSDRRYTIVIEKASAPRIMRLTAEEAGKYFSNGKEILVHAPARPSQDQVAEAQQAYDQELSAALAQRAGAPQPTDVALRPGRQSTCVVIQTSEQMAINKACPLPAAGSAGKITGE
jgi:hypothetical protein